MLICCDYESSSEFQSRARPRCSYKRMVQTVFCNQFILRGEGDGCCGRRTRTEYLNMNRDLMVRAEKSAEE